jgi:hypothetical protein
MIGWQTGQLRGVGIENLRITRSVTNLQHFVAFNNVHDSWIQGSGIVGGSEIDVGVHLIESRNVTIRQNWWGPLSGGGVFTTTSYGLAISTCSGCLIESNVFQNVESPIMLNQATVGSVIAYNYENTNGSFEGGFQTHEEGPTLNLYEGNSITKFWADFFHGNTVLNTHFRGHFYGGRGIDLSAYNRWYNAIGNVIVASTYQSVVTAGPHFSRFDSVAFRLGYPSQNASTATEQGVASDAVVVSTFMRWGNFITSDGVRFQASEVPSGIALFPNPVPASQTLPPSFYYASRPVWWPAAKVWPPIGPDVTGGNVSGVGGHANTTPAQDCFSAAGGNLVNFTPTTCYAQTAGAVPAAPWNVTLQ